MYCWSGEILIRWQAALKRKSCSSSSLRLNSSFFFCSRFLLSDSHCGTVLLLDTLYTCVRCSRGRTWRSSAGHSHSDTDSSSAASSFCQNFMLQHNSMPQHNFSCSVGVLEGWLAHTLMYERVHFCAHMRVREQQQQQQQQQQLHQPLQI